MSEGQFQLYRPPAHPKPESPRLEVERPPAARRRHVVARGDLECFLVPSVICSVIWLMTGAGYFWPMWVMLGTGMPVLVALAGRVPPHRSSGRGYRP